MQILSRLGRESQRKLRGLHREMLGKVRNWEEKGSQGGSTEPGRGGVGSPRAPPLRSALSACILAREGWPGGLSFRSPAQGGSPGSPLFGRLGRALGGAGGAWGWEAGGRCTELAARPGGAEGRGVGILGGLPPPALTHSTPRGKQALPVESFPFQEGRGIKVTNPFLRKKAKGDPGQLCSRSVPLLDHAPLQLSAWPQART